MTPLLIVSWFAIGVFNVFLAGMILADESIEETMPSAMFFFGPISTIALLAVLIVALLSKLVRKLNFISLMSIYKLGRKLRNGK